MNEEINNEANQVYFTILMTMLISTHAYAASLEQQEINKKVVTGFYDQIFNQKDFNEASKYLGDSYTEHNPNSVDGPEGLKEFIQFIRAKFPNASSEIKRVFADGDYVILHVHVIREPGTRGRAIFDLFKLNNGKIIEHWMRCRDTRSLGEFECMF